ncbi:putative Calcineurin like phosphoesterase [Trypanosoma vivax]|uniref:Uncharacterized protein n=1 Tax=Trypanosoma vivax (strain Y486) TaxID=1055687 RepID=G0U7W1_TRYVY|nr:hypothetical protein TRVL_07557 [Trypanosoma vivax]KAH8606271.1 putative Calcineurin like phosphoesterase [Trypanosoma vivax]KAH8620741.1 putative Calcineurin like phosphoesterase [Trypanosoma vivax]CCC51969.1 conserved hypothetical protein [Trypanosoma vivax Y486]
MFRHCLTRWRTAFVTDVEGDLSYFTRYVEHSKVVAWSGSRLLFRDDTSNFVYGGDAFDRGDDICFARALLEFHDAHKSRVHLILGNRDINKMVFGFPLHEALASSRLSPDAVQRLLFPNVLITGMGVKKALSYGEFLASLGLPPIPNETTLVQWALTHKLGAGRAFECRRGELVKLCSSPVSDENVSRSFLDAARPGGVYYDYLQRGKLAVVVDGVLFVHGSVVDENVGVVPEKCETFDSGSIHNSNIMLRGGSLDDWVSALSEFKEEGFARWSAGRGGLFLRNYAFPYFCVPYSVVVNSIVNSNGPRYLGLGGVEFLNRSGVSVVCGGHQPSGDTPCVVQQPGLLSIAADNSYSAGDDTRGLGVTEVLLEDDGTVCIGGLRSDGSPYSFSSSDRFVGRHIGDGWWVKSQSSTGLYEVQRTFDAYRSKEVQVLTVEEVSARLGSWREPPVDGEVPRKLDLKGPSSLLRALKTKRRPSFRGN